MNVFPSNFEKNENEPHSEQIKQFDDVENPFNSLSPVTFVDSDSDDLSEEQPHELSLTFMPGSEALDEFDKFFEATSRDKEFSEIAETPIFGTTSLNREIARLPMRRHSA